MKCSALLSVGRLPANDSSIMKLREVSFKILKYYFSFNTSKILMLVVVSQRKMYMLDLWCLHGGVVTGKGLFQPRALTVKSEQILGEVIEYRLYVYGC